MDNDLLCLMGKVRDTWVEGIEMEGMRGIGLEIRCGWRVCDGGVRLDGQSGFASDGINL
jgi:hypothetical protein